MRRVGFAAAAALLSGCSFLDGGYGASKAPHYAKAPQYGAPYGGRVDPCQIPHPRAPIPQGCHPSQVSLGVAPPATGFPQQPQFGAPQVATGGYGSHAAGNVHTAGLRGASAGPVKRRPRFRGALDIGAEKSLRGDIYDYDRFPTDPVDDYNAYRYVEGRSRREGDEIISEVFMADGYPEAGRANQFGAFLTDFYDVVPQPDLSDPDTWDEVYTPSVSFDDAWTTPSSFGVSGEWILGDRATVFGRVGYASAEGTNNDAVAIEATAYRFVSVQSVDPETGAPVGPPSNSLEYEPNIQIARYDYDFSDMNRLDLEAGGRMYLDPIAGRATGKTITPFVGASAGASRHNAVHYTVGQSQLSYETAFPEEGEMELEYFQIRDDAGRTRVDLYDSQWVPQGRLAAGVEWQVTPGTALALETGVRVEGSRKYSNGEKGDTNVSIPFTLRGSFNF